MTSETRPSRRRSRWVFLFVFSLIIAISELIVLALDYQNNSYQRQYVSQNTALVVGATAALLALAVAISSLVARRAAGQTIQGPRSSTFSRIASFVGRRYKLIIVFWILLLVSGLPLALRLSEVTTSNTNGGQSNSSQSAQAQSLMAQEFPHPQSNTSAIILLQGRDVTDNATKHFSLDLERSFLLPGTLNSVENVTSVYSLERAGLFEYYRQTDNYTYAEIQANQTLWADTLATYPVQLRPEILQNFVNPARSAMIIIVSFSQEPGSFGQADTDPILKNVVTMRTVLSQLRASDGGPTQTYVTGGLATTADGSIGSQSDLKLIEPVTVVAILVLVGLFFIAAVTPFVPLATIGMALFIAEGGLFLIGKYIVPIQDTTTTFLFTIMLGVGTDYAIFLMARYREERVEGQEKSQSIHTSVTWSGESIATSATTVIIAFSALTISSFTLLRSIGVGLAFGVLIALLVSLTLIPSLVMIAGDKVFWPTSGKRFEKYAARARTRRAERPGYFRRAAGFSVKRPALVLGLALLVSLPAIYVAVTGATTFDFTAGLTQAESVQGLKALEQSFGAGQIGPTKVLIQFPTPILVSGNLTTASATSLDNITWRILNLTNIESVIGPTRPNGIPIDATHMSRTTLSMVRIDIGTDYRTALVTVVFKQEPFTPDSLNTVSQIRGALASLKTTDSLLGSSTILVGGASASTLDFANETVGQFNTMRIITVGAIFIVLLVVLGSYPLALTGILSIGLSITWAYAATLLFFNDVLNSGVLFIIPLILFLLLYGIGMDYNIFILTRIKEEAQKGKDTRQAVVDAVDRTGGIITALALILAGALGSLLLSSNRLLQGFGFAIPLAVILDAMIVRTYLVPAIMSVLGPRAWWGPNRLRRVKVVNSKSPETSSNVASSNKPTP